MYADDLVLLSTTPAGLSNGLSKLNSYCNSWGLMVNEKKTNVLIFNKPGRVIKIWTLSISNENIENVLTYKYLGIEFAASGTFWYVKNELHKIH